MNIRKISILIVLVTMFVWSPMPASAGYGIWVYNSPWTISIINLTDYPITYLRDTEHDYGAWPYPTTTNDSGGCGGSQRMLGVGTDWTDVEPYRTLVWDGFPGCKVAPVFYNGRVTLYSKGFKDYTFDLIFTSQQASGLLEIGNWIGLDQHYNPNKFPMSLWFPASSDPSQNWAYGRYMTPIADSKMHNIMTLISPYLMVSLFCGNLNNLTVVVQQLIGTDPTTNKIVWDDTYEGYKGYQLDFVDNAGSSVP